MRAERAEHRKAEANPFAKIYQNLIHIKRPKQFVGADALIRSYLDARVCGTMQASSPTIFYGGFPSEKTQGLQQSYSPFCVLG